MNCVHNATATISISDLNSAPRNHIFLIINDLQLSATSNNLGSKDLKRSTGCLIAWVKSCEFFPTFEKALEKLGFKRSGRCFSHAKCPYLIDFVNTSVKTLCLTWLILAEWLHSYNAGIERSIHP